MTITITDDRSSIRITVTDYIDDNQSLLIKLLLQLLDLRVISTAINEWTSLYIE